MAKKSESIYQFKITLEGIRPTIWRRIQVPDFYSFWDLHVAIQDAMGWTDTHLHEFEILNPKYCEKDKIGIPNDEDFEPVITGWKAFIKNYFSLQNKKANYDYDFGDDWRHKILLEKILPVTPGVKYPLCIAGERACPPEDCGGIWGYQNILEIIKDPTHDEYESTIEWLGQEFHPDAFFFGQVKFDNPKSRKKMALSIF
jgi:hypothetical protein